MAARFTLASGLTDNKYCNYIASFSVRSLSTLALLTVTITLCFIYSSSGPNYLTSTMDGFLFAQNKTHLLSTATYDCLYCEQPPTFGYTQEQLFEACLDPGVVPEYYLSVILPSRPMEYSAEYYARLQNTIDSTFLMAENSKTLMELVLVEWNPEPQRRPPRDTYRFRRSDYLTYRIITVPRKIHQSLQQPERAAMYEYEAKNVGIRFARGEFVLTVNNDVLWTPNMINAITSRSWRKGMFYTQSQNTTSTSVENDPLTVQLPNFSTDNDLHNVCKHHNNYGKGNFKMANLVPMDTDNYSKMTRNAGDFILADRESWRLTQGYRETGATSGMDTELLLTAAWTLDLPVAFQPTTTFNCHQQPRSVQGASVVNPGVDINGLKTKKVAYMNKSGQWGLQGRNLYKEGVQCEVFRGGLGM